MQAAKWQMTELDSTQKTVVACLEEGRLDLCSWPDDNSDLCAAV